MGHDYEMNPNPTERNDEREQRLRLDSRVSIKKAKSALGSLDIEFLAYLLEKHYVLVLIIHYAPTLSNARLTIHFSLFFVSCELEFFYFIFCCAIMFYRILLCVEDLNLKSGIDRLFDDQSNGTAETT